MKSLSQPNNAAHFGDLKQKIDDLVGDFTKNFVTRMDGAPRKINIGIPEMVNFQLYEAEIWGYNEKNNGFHVTPKNMLRPVKLGDENVIGIRAFNK